jgi:hypothetical protein
MKRPVTFFAIIFLTLLISLTSTAWILTHRNPPLPIPLTVNQLCYSLNAHADLPIPPNIAKLDGKRVTILGNIWDPYADENSRVSRFDLTTCPYPGEFNGPPLAQEFVHVNLNPGIPSDSIFINDQYIDDQFRVTGILHVKTETSDGRITSIYHLDAYDAQPVNVAHKNNPVDLNLFQWTTPAILLIAVLASMRFLWLVLKRQHRQQHGFCTHCGYDLRSTPNLCPECGTIPKSAIRDFENHHLLQRATRSNSK